MADVDVKRMVVGLIVGTLLLLAGKRWVAETIENTTGGLLNA